MDQIEFELKFYLIENPKNLSTLEYLGSKEQVDEYFDTKNHSLYMNGDFIRVRNNAKLEFKIDIGDKKHFRVKETNFNQSDVTSSNKNLNAICRELGMSEDVKYENIEGFLLSNGLERIAKIHKTRKEYRLSSSINIALDHVVDLGNFLEAEVILDSKKEVVDDELVNFLLTELYSRDLIDNAFEVNVGYVELYLFRNNRVVYDKGAFKMDEKLTELILNSSPDIRHDPLIQKHNVL